MDMIYHHLKKDLVRCRALIIGWWLFLFAQLLLFLFQDQLLDDLQVSFFLRFTVLSFVNYMALIISIAFVILEDNVVDPKAFWLTLPISPMKVLAAKILLIIVGIVPPAFLSRALHLTSQGFGGLELPTMMTNRLWFFGIVIVAGVGLASIVPNLRIFLAVLLLAYAVPSFVPWYIVRGFFGGGSDLQWLVFGLLRQLLIIFAVFAVIYQYRTRNTEVARVLWGILLISFHLFRLW